MSAKYIVAGLVGSCAISYACDYIVSQKKIFGGTIPGTVSDKEWWQATEKRFQAWPRTAGPPVIMNPISRQNFIVKDLNPWGLIPWGSWPEAHAEGFFWTGLGRSGDCLCCYNLLFCAAILRLLCLNNKTVLLPYLYGSLACFAFRLLPSWHGHDVFLCSILWYYSVILWAATRIYIYIYMPCKKEFILHPSSNTSIQMAWKLLCFTIILASISWFS